MFCPPFNSGEVRLEPFVPQDEQMLWPRAEREWDCDPDCHCQFEEHEHLYESLMPPELGSVFLITQEGTFCLEENVIGHHLMSL